MKKTLLWILPAALLATASPKTEAQAINIDGYAARVNDRIVTKGEIWETLLPMLADLQRSYQGEILEQKIEEFYYKARTTFIEHALILEEFAARGGQIPAHYVEAEIDRAVKTQYYGDKALFEQALADRKTTRQEFKKQIREQIIVSLMLQEEISRRVRVSPAQVLAAYQTNLEDYTIPAKVEHSVILINKGATEDEQAVKRAEAERIRQRLIAGEDFAELARALSEGGRANEGGRFPWMQPKDAQPALQPILETLPAGTLSELIESDSAFYLVKIHARQQASVQPFETVRAAIEKNLSEQEFERLKSRWIEQLKRKHFVAVY